MALVSPGVEVQVIDESIYAPTAVATIPTLFVASATDKLTAAGDAVASGTLEVNANKLYLISSQRELVTTFGAPQFYKDSNGTPLHGYEINEYGLMAAYSALGVSNRVYVIRADVDLSELVGTAVRPSSAPADGTTWFDLTTTSFGLFEWDATNKIFDAITPTVITDTALMTGGSFGNAPLASIGKVGDYAIIAGSVNNPGWFKNYLGVWVNIGDAAWQASNPAVQGSNANPGISIGWQIDVNDNLVTCTGTTVGSVASDITALGLTGLTVTTIDGRLSFFIDDTVGTDGSSTQGALDLAEGGVGGAALFAALGITAGTFYPPTIQFSSHVSVPAWKDTDTTPRPSGSVWHKTSSANFGSSFVVKVYNELTATWNLVAAPLYADDPAAITALDPSGGGKNIAAGSFYAKYNLAGDNEVRTKIYERALSGPLVVTGDTSGTLVFGGTDDFTVQVTRIGTVGFTSPVTVLAGTTAQTFVQNILTAGIPEIDASVNASGQIVLTHLNGGAIQLDNVTNTPVTTAGFITSATFVRIQPGGEALLSHWVGATYTASLDQPTVDPVDGTYWYYSSVSDVDIMVHNGTNWIGYQNETNDARGYDLSTADPVGPIVGASAPTEQSDTTALEYGDLWVDTSDLENYPRLHRWDNVASTGKWVLIDNTDQTTENGIVFGDARWDTDGTTDIVTGDFTTIVDLLTSDSLDLDAPDPALYPRGTLLWNTRRSGYNVKKFAADYFNATDYPDDILPTVTDTWQNASGNKNDGSPYMGRKAVRVIVSGAIGAAIETNNEIREEQYQFNLMCAPGYPEVADNLIALNNDRRNTAFIIGDTPFRLAANGTALQSWALGNDEDSITNASEYIGVFYPSGVTSNPFTTGNTEILVPPSHMAVRLMIRNDDVAFPWFAPAGTRRGLVDNASRVGYIDSTTGELRYVGLTESLRDTLYESKINPITLFPGVGLVNFGQKTLYPNASALDRINVARLLVYMRERLQQIVKPFLFEPNDKITRDEVKQVCESLCNDLTAKRGLYDYLVVCDETNNTPDRIDRNELYVDIAIEPVKAVEFIYIPLRIKNTGEISSS